MGFVKDLGPQALPREWYIMAAHQHYWEWHATSPDDPESWDKLYGLYGKVAASNWSSLRQDESGRLAAAGISYKCASDPPTIPWVNNETDWGVFVWPILIPLSICCCVCCFFSCRLCCRICCPCCPRCWACCYPNKDREYDKLIGPDSATSNDSYAPSSVSGS